MKFRVSPLGLLAGVLVLISSLAIIQPVSGQNPDNKVVRAVLFWSVGCGHCEETFSNILPPIREEYGAMFELQLVEVSSMKDVDALFALGEVYNIPKENIGVPLLLLDQTALVGSDQIREQLPKLIANYLTVGGVDLPDKPELRAMLEVTNLGLNPATPASPSNDSAPASVEPVRDSGFTLAIVVLLGMLVALIFAIGRLITGMMQQTLPAPLPNWLDLAIPVLSVLGLAVAIYLSYIEISLSKAFCGPVGDCNAVQASPYARVWGILPVGVLGGLGYIAILIVWWISRYRQNSIKIFSYAPIALFGMTFFGTLFSAYLTYLEPFVIRAVCIWCITSAVLITLLLLLSLTPALRALKAEKIIG